MELNNFNTDFYNPETELNEKYSNEINMHKVMRNARKCFTIIVGLNFEKKENIKEFITIISSKFGISGCHKMMEDYDKKNKVFVFSGDKRDDIKNVLITTFNREDEFIKYHG